MLCAQCISVVFFFFNDTATTEIYTLSLHDALPIWPRRGTRRGGHRCRVGVPPTQRRRGARTGRPARARGRTRRRRRPRRRTTEDRKSTRLNSSHANISYAVFCLKKKKTTHKSIL